MPTCKHTRALREVIIPIGPSIAYVPLTQGQFALIDSADAEELARFRWYAVGNKAQNSFYAMRKIRTFDNRRIHLGIHQQLMGDCPFNHIVDHANGNSLDDRRCNLRFATASQNTMNSRRMSSNDCGFKGVYWHKKNRYYIARIMVNGKRRSLGCFNTPEAAHEAYARAACKHFGQFARAA